MGGARLVRLGLRKTTAAIQGPSATDCRLPARTGAPQGHVLLFLLCIAFNREFFDTGPNVGALYPVEVIPLGALIGGFIFGAYWVITGLLARMHTGNSFGALGIRNYRELVRMKFEKDKLTIYPIGVKKLQSTKSFSKLCRKLNEPSPAEGSPEERKPLLPIALPRAELIPDLKNKVEPIVIWRNKARDVAPANTLQAAE